MGASSAGENKIHLGLTYALDAPTATDLLGAALRFGPLLEKWLGSPIGWGGLTSEPFSYVVAADSLLDEHALAEHYERLQEVYESMADDGRYLGGDPQRLVGDPGTDALGNRIFPTAERALEPSRLNALLLDAFSGTPFTGGQHVEQVERDASGFVVGGANADGERWSEPADVVVNCLWDGRAAIDASIGLPEEGALVHRRRVGLVGRCASASVATSM